MTAFWDAQGSLTREFMGQVEKLNADHYRTTLRRLKDVIWMKPRRLLTDKVAFLHDKAWPRTARASAQLLDQFRWKHLAHPPYMPDLALNDFKVFDPVKSTSKINASNVMMM